MPKSREVLVYLALHGPSTYEQVVDAIWPHLDLQSGRNNLKAQIRLLRHTIAACLKRKDLDPIIWDKARGNYRLNNDLELVVDASELKGAQGNPSFEVRHRVFMGYRGDFLPGVESAWVIEQRMHSREVAVLIGLGLANEMKYTDRIAAITLYRRVIEIEPLIEEPYQALIELHQAEGDIAQAQVVKRSLERATGEHRSS